MILTTMIIFAAVVLGFVYGRQYERGTVKTEMLVFCAHCPLSDMIRTSPEFRETWKAHTTAKLHDPKQPDHAYYKMHPSVKVHGVEYAEGNGNKQH